MERKFHSENRQALYQSMENQALALFFSGSAPRKTSDEYYPFFANRNFVYLAGIEQAQSVLLAVKQAGGVEERLYLLPPDPLAERWTGSRLKPAEAEAASGLGEIRAAESWQREAEALLKGGEIKSVYLDFDKFSPEEPDSAAYRFAACVQERYPYISLRDAHPQLARQRTIKKPCEIAAMREAQKITRAGILAMMQASKPGMFEYQYKAEFDYALAQHGVLAPGFPPIISTGANNFCIHYYAYRGQAQDGEMILNDVGACYDNQINDVSRGWPCNGRFSERQRLLYECAYATSQQMFATLKPGLAMAEVDATIRRYNFERLKEAGVCRDFADIGTYMWHGGAHHVGYDVHDVVDMSQPLTPGMVFCVDIGIYHQDWGIGFRLEDNCLITATGAENLSAATPRSIEEIEAAMGRR